MARNAQTPTHEAAHNGRIAHIYLAESLQEKLRSRNSTVLWGARNSVCIRFRKAVQAKYGLDIGHIEWHQLKLTKLTLVPMATLVGAAAGRYGGPIPTIEDDLTDPYFNAADECDECPRCEESVHEQCRSGNCPLAVRWRR